MVGLVLLIVGKNVSQYLPPNYSGDDDGFLELMRTTGMVIRIVGVVLLVAGGIVAFLFH